MAMQDATATEAVDDEAANADGAVRLPEPWASAHLTVVVPTYNEATNLPILVKALFALPLPNLRVLVADDNSPDGTGKIADELAAEYGTDRIRVVHRKAKEGLGRAYVDGMARALEDGAEFVIQMDADLSHPPEYVPQMLGTMLSTKASVVVGSRYVTGGVLAQEWKWHRRLLSRWANFYVQSLLHTRVRDVTAGYKLWRASTLRALNLDAVRSTGYSFQVEMNYRVVRLGMKIVEVPIHFDERLDGVSKMSLSTQLESMVMPFKLRRAVRRHG